MILANYWKLLMNTVYDNETTSNTHNLVATDGTVFSDYTHRHPTNTSITPIYWKGIQLRTFDGFLIGDGSTPGSPTDYSLSGSDITDHITNARLVIDNSSESGRFNTSIIISGEYSWNNNPFTIRKFGLYKNILYGTLASEVRRVLVAKSVLEEPIYMTKGSLFRIVADWIQS